MVAVYCLLSLVPLLRQYLLLLAARFPGFLINWCHTLREGEFAIAGTFDENGCHGQLVLKKLLHLVTELVLHRLVEVLTLVGEHIPDMLKQLWLLEVVFGRAILLGFHPLKYGSKSEQAFSLVLSLSPGIVWRLATDPVLASFDVGVVYEFLEQSYVLVEDCNGIQVTNIENRREVAILR